MAAREGETALVTSATQSVVMTASGALAVAVGLSHHLTLELAFTPKVMAAFCIIVSIVMLNLPRIHGRDRFGAANQVTLVRAATVAMLLGLVGEPANQQVAWAAVGLALVVAALDGLDGWVARRLRLASDFGARFDMETDALLIAVLAVLAWQLDKAGAWVMLGGLMRYGFVMAGVFLPWLRRSLPPSRRRQAVCVGQMLSLVVCITPLVAMPYSASIAVFGASALATSFALDIAWLARHRNRDHDEDGRP